jgi:hypothetical protein
MFLSRITPELTGEQLTLVMKSNLIASPVEELLGSARRPNSFSLALE